MASAATAQGRPSPSPSPVPGGKPKPINTRASLQPTPAAPRTPAGPAPLSPRPHGINIGSGRPTSELLNTGTSVAFQTPEVDAIDQWFENLQNYETTLEEMAAASLDVNFKEELSAIEQWFRVLSEAERTAAMYSLLQHSTQMQIRFFITVLQQMARSDPMTALLSPNIGASMQNQMEAKLASLGLKSPAIPPSPGPRNLSASLNRQSVAADGSSFLSPESANTYTGNSDAAATLAQQRARLKANAAHRISAPGTLSQFSEGGHRASGAWTSSQLGQVVERSPSPGATAEAGSATASPSRPKSTDFQGIANSIRSPRLGQLGQAENQSLEDQLSPMVGGNWASMSNTPVAPMFGPASGAAGGRDTGSSLEATAAKLASWNKSNNTNGRMVLDDARKFRRNSGIIQEAGGNSIVNGDNVSSSTQDNAGNAQSARGGNNAFAAGLKAPQGQGWGAQRSPAMSNSSRFGDEHSDMLGNANLAAANLAALGSANPQLQAQMLALAQAQAQMGMNPAFGMLNPISPLAMNGLMPGVDMNLQAQLFAAQLAAGGYNNGFGGSQNGRRGPGSSRSPGNKASSANGRSDKKDEDEVDPALLNDVPAWLRSLRLHKYTPNFQGSTWQEMVAMDEAQLEAKGVAALGARRKLLKTFETVRLKMGLESSDEVSHGEANDAETS